MSFTYAPLVVLLARGNTQRAWLQDAIAGWQRGYPNMLTGRAQTYRRHYQESFDALLSRAHQAGVVIARRPGPRGGETAATYHVLGIMES